MKNEGEEEVRGQAWYEGLLGHPLVSRRQFYPRRDDEPLPPQFALTVPTTYSPAEPRDAPKTGEESTLPSLSCYYYRSPNKHPNKKTVVHFHGNGELVSSYVRAPAVEGIPSLYGCLREMGVDVLFVEYRGYGSSGGEVHMGAMLDDVSAVLNTLEVPAGDVVVFGRSMGSVFTIEATARFPNLCGIVVESGLSDLYPLMIQRMSPADLMGLHDYIVETTSGAGSEPPQGDSEEEKQDVVRASLRTACDRVLALDRKWQAYRGNVLLLHCEDDQALPPSEANTNYERAWASWREEGEVVASASPDAAPHKKAERLKDEPEARVSDEVIETVVVADDTADGGQRRVMKRKVLFCAGGHQYIWPMNWPRYRDEVARFLDHCGHQVAEDFDSADSVSGASLRATTSPRKQPLNSHARATHNGRCLLA